MRGREWTKLLRRLFAAAERHGNESDPEHEVGDLQDLVRLLWSRVDVSARESIWHAVADQLETWGTP